MGNFISDTQLDSLAGEHSLKSGDTIEVIRQVSRRPDAGISCYYCDECHAIFTKVSTAGIEYCPACRKNWADRIPKAWYNILKAWRRCRIWTFGQTCHDEGQAQEQAQEARLRTDAGLHTKFMRW